MEAPKVSFRQSPAYMRFMNPFMQIEIAKQVDFYDVKSHKVEECPLLVEYSKRLQEQGLKDPHIRNLVWKYHPCNQWFPRSRAGKLRIVATKGMLPGLVIALSIIAYQKITAVPKKGGAHH